MSESQYRIKFTSIFDLKIRCGSEICYKLCAVICLRERGGGAGWRPLNVHFHLFPFILSSFFIHLDFDFHLDLLWIILIIFISLNQEICSGFSFVDLQHQNFSIVEFDDPQQRLSGLGVESESDSGFGFGDLKVFFINSGFGFGDLPN